jgi:hypothetical protein
MILSMENLNGRRETCSSVILSTTNITRIDLRSKPGLFGSNSLTKRLTRGDGLLKPEIRRTYKNPIRTPQ